MAKRSNRSPNAHGPSGPVIAGSSQGRRGTKWNPNDDGLLFLLRGTTESNASEAADIGGAKGSEQPDLPPAPFGDGI